MRKGVYLFAAVIMLMLSCKPSVPTSVIQPDDMEDMLFDYHISRAMAHQSEPANERDIRNREYILAMLRKHNVSEAEFDSALLYYYSHVDYLKRIYDGVNERLANEAKALGAKVGAIGRYSQYSATGDTANIWKDATDVMLMPYPTMNRFDFEVKADTSFHKGDAFMFQFMTEYLWQVGMKEATICLISKYEGDSIIQSYNQVAVSGIAQVRVPVYREGRLKEMKGFIYLGDGGDETDTRKMMFVSQIQLIRFHQKQSDNEPSTNGAQKKDSLQRAADFNGPAHDSLRFRTIGRRVGGTPVPPHRGAPANGVAHGPDNP